MTLVTFFQVKEEFRRDFGWLSLEGLREITKQPDTISMKHYQAVSTEEDVDGWVLLYTGPENDPLKLLNKLFEITNSPAHQNERKHFTSLFHFTGVSISVGDIVRIDETYYYCDSFGWVPIEVTNVPNWVKVGMGATGCYFSDLYPLEVVKVTPSGKTVTLRAMNATPAPEFDYHSNQVYIYTSNPEGEVFVARRLKNGRWKTSSGMRVGIGNTRKYDDPHV